MFTYLYKQVKDMPVLLLPILLFLAMVYKDIQAGTFWGSIKAKETTSVSCQAANPKDWI